MAKNVNKASDPKIYHRDETPTIGIRIVTPYAGMFAEVTKLRKEIVQWLKEQEIEPSGYGYLRYYVIDMAGNMDIEYGYVVEEPIAGNGRIQPGSLPAGRYVSLIYSGGGYQGNKALVEHVRSNNLPVDRWDTPEGDNFRCRFEMYLTDPKIEPRKTKWDIEVAFKLKDE
ncbi:MAG: GyrI-like domain-containing protein [Candidatus Promineifilaceae bacterium]